MSRLEKKFRELRRSGKKAFIAFLTCGYPNLWTTEKLILEFSRIGVDVIELGVPFSDPMADGPIIQEASQHALKNKVNLSRIFSLARRVRKHTEVPLCIMTYYNPVFCFGENNFVRACVECGIDGIIIPDLPPEESLSLNRMTVKNGLDLVHFISPTTPLDRVRMIARACRGFIYYVSLTGVTGPRKKLPQDLKRHLKTIKRIAAKPICVGFGISLPSQVSQVYKIADGVIVGSAIIMKIKENMHNPDIVSRVSRFVSGLLWRPRRSLCTKR